MASLGQASGKLPFAFGVAADMELNQIGDRSKLTCQPGSCRFGSAPGYRLQFRLAAAKTCKTSCAFALDKRAKSLMDQCGSLGYFGDTNGVIDKTVVEIDCGAHVSLS